MLTTALNPLLTLCTTIFVIIVAAIDLSSHRIPNLLTLPAALIAVGLQVCDEGIRGLTVALSGFAVGLILFLPFYIRRAFGAGDVKAMAAIGAFLGPTGALMAAAWTLVAGAVMGLTVLASHGGLRAIETMRQRWILRLMLLVSAGPGPGIHPPSTDAASRRFPYGCAIAAGTLISLWMNGSLQRTAAAVLGH